MWSPVAKSCKDLRPRIGVATPNLFGYRPVSLFQATIPSIPILTDLVSTLVNSLYSMKASSLWNAILMTLNNHTLAIPETFLAALTWENFDHSNVSDVLNRWWFRGMRPDQYSSTPTTVFVTHFDWFVESLFRRMTDLEARLMRLGLQQYFRTFVTYYFDTWLRSQYLNPSKGDYSRNISPRNVLISFGGSVWDVGGYVPFSHLDHTPSNPISTGNDHVELWRWQHSISGSIWFVLYNRSDYAW